MKNTKMKTTTLALIILLAAMLVSMVGTSCVQTNGWSVKETTFRGSLSELNDLVQNNLSATGREVEITFEPNAAAQICLSTYIPKNATPASPAPVIICAHGYNNSKEMQLSNITELARRGYVVVAFDLAGHGRSDITINDYTSGTEGMLAAVQYAMSLDCIDIDRVGVTGHSAGDLACINTVKLINTPEGKNHIAAFFCPTGTIAALFASGDCLNNLVLGVAPGRYDELDTFYFGTAHFMETPTAAMLVQRFYPEFAESSVPEGQYYSANGAVSIPGGGQAMQEKQAVAIWNPGITHPQGTFSKIATKLTIDFFYNAFGTPSGATYRNSDSQHWTLGVVFQTIGLLAFFALAIVMGGVLLETPAFSDLKGEVEPQEKLASIKDRRELIPIIVTFVPLLLFPYFAYFPCFGAAEKLLNPDSYPAPTANGIAWFTLCSGVFCFLMLGVNSIVKRLCYRKSAEAVRDPFLPGNPGGWTRFFKTVGLAAAVIALIYVPCYIAYYVFNMNFGISVYTVGLPRAQWLPDILFKYLPMWFVFLLPNAILNADTRFKELPEWASTLFCALANLLPIAVSITANYVHLVKQGATLFTFGDPSIMAFNLLAPMIFIAISGRYYYKKTGNAWAGAMVNASVLTFMALTLTRHTSAWMFSF